MLRRTPVFTVVALLTLALGLGANTAIFSIINGVILRPLDCPRPEQLMYLTTDFPALGLTGNALSVQEYLEFREINQSFAMVGAYRTIGGAYTTGRSQRTVIGVAKDVKQGGVEKQTGTELYISLDQLAMAAPTMNVALRTTLSPAGLSPTLERLVRDVDPAVPIVRLREMDAVFAESIRRPRLLAQLLGAFAGLALLLAAVGTYGVLSYIVTERRREIGVRMALGASRSSVIRLVMKDGLQATVIGIVAGVAGALCRKPDDGFPPVRRPADRRRDDGSSDCDDFDSRRIRMLVAWVAGVAAGPERGTQS